MAAKNTVANFILWGLVMIAGGLSIYQGINYNSLLDLKSPVSSLLILICVAFVFFHGIRRYGWKDLLVFFLASYIIVFIFENLSVATGFPMGHFHYGDLVGIKLLNEPVTVPVVVFPMIYLSWTMAHIVMDYYKNCLKGKYIVILPIIAAFIFIMWDAVTDPSLSTVINLFTWDHGGAYFGVPFPCDFGMFFYMYILFQVFALYLRRTSEDKTSKMLCAKNFWLQPLAFYSTYPIAYMLVGFFVKDRIITTFGQRAWHLKDLLQTAGMISFVTVIFIIILSLLKIIVLDRIPRE